MIYKLRFRLQGRQKVRYLGTDADYVASVVHALQLLQRDRVTIRNLKRLTREAARAYEAWDHRVRAVEQFLKVYKQVERLAQLDLRLRELLAADSPVQPRPAAPQTEAKK